MYLDPSRMVEILRGQGVEIAVEDFQRIELTARRILHDRIEEGSKGTEPELWGQYFVSLFSGCGVLDRKSTRLNSSHSQQSRMPSSA